MFDIHFYVDMAVTFYKYIICTIRTNKNIIYTMLYALLYFLCIPCMLFLRECTILKLLLCLLSTRTVHSFHRYLLHVYVPIFIFAHCFNNTNSFL